MSSERRFPVFDRGEIREDILTSWRNGLRLMTNPVTGLTFTEEEIALATADFTRWWAEANAIDIVLLAVQSRALFISDQVLPDRASSVWLLRHGLARVGPKRDASGGAGSATSECLLGSTFIGSTSIPDNAAHYATDPAGRRYQVVATKVATGDTIQLAFKAVDTGRGTNLLAGTELTWQVAPVGAGEMTVDAQFVGGGPAETDQAYADRILSAMHDKQGSGNRDMVRSLCESSDGAIEAAFVYAAAYHAGSMHVCMTVEREGVAGPLARVAPAATVLLGASVLTPPGTREVPGQVTTVVSGDRSWPVELAIEIDMVRGGWVDAQPWPIGVAGVVVVPDEVSSQTTLKIDASEAPEGLPSFSAWNETLSRWEVLDVLSVTYDSGNAYDVVLNTAASFTLTTSTFISPTATFDDEIAESVEIYFDSLGPGELVSDERISRAFRYPTPTTKWPSEISLTELGDYMKAALGSVIGQRGLSLISASDTAPPVPSDPTQGPWRLTLGKFAIYPRST